MRAYHYDKDSQDKNHSSNYINLDCDIVKKIIVDKTNIDKEITDIGCYLKIYY